MNHYVDKIMNLQRGTCGKLVDGTSVFPLSFLSVKVKKVVGTSELHYIKEYLRFKYWPQILSFRLSLRRKIEENFLEREKYLNFLG